MHLIQRLLFGLHLKLTKRHRIRGKDVFLRSSPKFRRIVGPYPPSDTNLGYAAGKQRFFFFSDMFLLLVLLD